MCKHIICFGFTVFIFPDIYELSEPQKSVVVRLLRRGKSANQRPCRQQESAYSWLVCISGLLASTLVFGVSYSYGVLFPVLLNEFQQGKARTGKSDNINSKRMRRCEVRSPK